MIIENVVIEKESPKIVGTQEMYNYWRTGGIPSLSIDLDFLTWRAWMENYYGACHLEGEFQNDPH